MAILQVENIQKKFGKTSVLKGIKMCIRDSIQGGHGVQIAGGQTAKTAVAQAGIRLRLKELRSGEAQALDRCV